MQKLPQRWLEKINILDIAFQPILNIHTGKLYGVEALLRNYQEAGFYSIFEVYLLPHKPQTPSPGTL